MAEGIKNKVAIIGMGCTKFGEHFGRSHESLASEAFQEAIEDAGIEKKDIGAAWFSSCFDEVNVGKSAIPLAGALKLPFIPITRVENFCASGTEAIRAASYAVASGACDIALALGVEKLKDIGYGGLPDFSQLRGIYNRQVFPNVTAPGLFAMLATKYFDRYGLSPEEGKRTLAKISAKSHANGAMTPKAHLRRKVDVETIMNAPMIAWPLGLFDCCGVTEGAAAAIVVRAEDAKKFRPDPLYSKAQQIAVSPEEEYRFNQWDGTHVETTYRCGVRAYEEAGVKNPRGEISMMEVHDCFSITELVIYEDLQISPRGKAKDDVDAGFYNLDGQIPCQTDGGLKSFGHPIGASGIRMTYEVYKQLQGKAGERQIKNPRLGLTQNLGGFPPNCVIGVTIWGNEL
ncbi:acetyl-CoA C-acetyltransferase [Desulfosarcina sp. BuS5]|uniref:acetyl-CoA acetyltransferase n=1 Tax=Desulfosarcina sp. BuS5 TaxID=933262 RepID=UPI00048839B6|nr:acetyl-CoA acetyltransferase [Desulfosarcina sp. BuS5]WDN90640.1 acetyl-CoA C-acetyltransferase [Desulfosarcina sp. BuS5]